MKTKKLEYEIVHGRKKYKLYKGSPLWPWEEKCADCGKMTKPGHRLEITGIETFRNENASNYTVIFCPDHAKDVWAFFTDKPHSFGR
jgi:hypothetical protein